jgi:hypothetical protein
MKKKRDVLLLKIICVNYRTADAEYVDIARSSQPEVGKVTLKSNSDEALRNESLKKINSNEALNDDFP